MNQDRYSAIKTNFLQPRLRTFTFAAAIALGLNTAYAVPVDPDIAPPPLAPGENRVSFDVEVQDLTVNFDTFFATVLPGELLTLQVRGRPDTHDISFETDVTAGVLADKLQLAWKAPQTPGLYPIVVRDNDSSETMTINVFVLEPASNIENGRLNGYRIGQYPEKPLRGNPIYKKPLGFIEVPDDLKETKVSPNFTVGQFLCKQKTTARAKYLVLRPALLVKLERVAQLLQENDVETESLFVMSGYRTPFYNAAIKNVKYSRHIYGGAADIYVDFKPRDGDMDDINKDGVVDKKDAAYLFDLIDNFDKDNVNMEPQGGLGEYDRNSVRGPFVHVDVRGVPARWGR